MTALHLWCPTPCLDTPPCCLSSRHEHWHLPPTALPLALLPAGIIGLEASYIIPIFLRLTVARTWFKRGPFHLGALSIPMGWVAVVWGVFISAVLVLPT